MTFWKVNQGVGGDGLREARNFLSQLSQEQKRARVRDYRLNGREDDVPTCRSLSSQNFWAFDALASLDRNISRAETWPLASGNERKVRLPGNGTPPPH